MNGTKFGLICEADGIRATKTLKWVRFPAITYNSRMGISRSRWYAITYIPRRNIYFHGFGIIGNYHSVNMHIKIKWMIDDHESEEYEYHCLDEQKDPVKKWFEIYLRDFK